MAFLWMLAGSVFAFVAFVPLRMRQQEWFLDAILIAIGYPGILLSALFALGWMRNLVQLDGVVLSIGPLGIVDRRMSERLIPWSAILRVHGENMEGPAIALGIRLDPKFDSTWPKYFDARLTSLIVRLFGRSAFVYSISALGLRASFKDVEEAVLRYKYFDRWGTSGF